MAFDSQRYQGEQLQAELQTAGSRLVQWVPILDRLVGYSDSPLYKPLRWQHLRTQTATHERVDQEWNYFKGDPRVKSNLPKHFKRVAIMTAFRHGIDAHCQEAPGQQAVAYKFGEDRIMVGTRPNGEAFFDTHVKNMQLYEFGLRLGRDALQSSMGVLRQDGTYVSYAGDLLPHKAVSIDDVETHFS